MSTLQIQGRQIPGKLCTIACFELPKEYIKYRRKFEGPNSVTKRTDKMKFEERSSQ